MTIPVIGAIVGSVIKMVGGNAIGTLADRLSDAYKAKLAAKNDTERLVHEERIETLKAQMAVLLEEQKRADTRFIRPALALPFIVYIWKIVVWDKVLGWGVTDPLSPELTWMMTAIFGVYFLVRGVKDWK